MYFLPWYYNHVYSPSFFTSLSCKLSITATSIFALGFSLYQKKYKLKCVISCMCIMCKRLELQISLIYSQSMNVFSVGIASIIRIHCDWLMASFACSFVNVPCNSCRSLSLILQLSHAVEVVELSQ